VAAEPGLRERKKQATRERISAAAAQLFAERGFDAVTVADVARAADVSVGTVFNYFPTKEDLFYSRMEDFESALLESVRERAPGESVLAAFRRVIREGTDGLEADERTRQISDALRTVNDSAALRAREREVVARATQALADLIAEETESEADDVRPLVAANALMGVQRALVVYVHTQVLEGVRGRPLVADVRARADEAFAQLEQGLADYAVKPGRDV
jgi:AcrR family transcriptional regulator